jgi:biotin carboxyl carrier protein
VRLALPVTAANAAVLLAGILVAATAAAGSSPALVPAPGPAPVAAAPATALPTARPTAPVVVPPAVRTTARPPVRATAPATPRPAAPPVRRSTMRTGFGPYASVGPVTLHYPGDVVEVVGLHQSGHDGAQPQQPLRGGKRIGLLGSRARDTDGQGAADIVVDPTRPVRSPVTGTVLRAGTYTLYCDHVDEYLVVEPDARPGWEVKLLHFEGLRVEKGDRVQAGVTVVGARARVLPFASQVDKHTVAPHWPHLHVEVVDTAVEDRPSGATCD